MKRERVVMLKIVEVMPIDIVAFDRDRDRPALLDAGESFDVVDEITRLGPPPGQTLPTNITGNRERAARAQVGRCGSNPIDG